MFLCSKYFKIKTFINNLCNYINSSMKLEKIIKRNSIIFSLYIYFVSFSLIFLNIINSSLCGGNENGYELKTELSFKYCKTI
jgi:hypothetical protein